MRKRRSIRTKLVGVVSIILLIAFLMNIYISYNQSKTLRQIDIVYNNNMRLNELMDHLDEVQQSLYRYLNTKSSEQLEKFYLHVEEYNEILGKMNRKTVDSSVGLMEKNICNMSATYLETVNEVVEAKRGRNISKYKEGYEEAQRLYGYLQSCINSLNMSAFQENSDIYSTLRAFLKAIFLVGWIFMIGVIIIAIVSAIAITRSLMKPLSKLADVANEIAKGNMDVKFPIVETGDEVALVAKACNKMIESIRIYIQTIKENYERESKLLEHELSMQNDLKEAQLKYLQAQINPHFLFNSLNAGAQLAMMEGAERAYLFIENMADFFRYNVRKISHDTTLKEELELVNNYVYILNVRFAGEIHYSTRLDERLLDTLMPSMILQPLIENSVNHGIREKEGGGEIKVSVYANQDKVCIKVEDDGVGIKDEIIEKILRGESAHSNSQRDSAGIGLDNVINRLRTYYDMEHVIDIGRRDGGGTEIILYIWKGKGGQSGAHTNL